MSNKKQRNQDKTSQNIGPIFSASIDGKICQSSRFVRLRSNWPLMAVMVFLSISALGAGLKYLDEDARREMARRVDGRGRINDAEETSLLSRINPFLPAAAPDPTPQLSKEYIYAGDRLLAVEDANAGAAPPADLAVWRPSTGDWWVMGGAGSRQTSQAWGTNNDVPRPGDYDGDGRTDFCVYRKDAAARTATWYIMYSSTGGTAQIQYGLDTDKPAQADFDGDGKTDIAVYRASNGYWYIHQSSDSTTVSRTFGSSLDEPVPADFDGDGKADTAVWRDANNTFYSSNSTNNQAQTRAYGAAGDKPVIGDYDGDGKDDIAVWRTSNRTWYYRKSSDGSTISYQWGSATDLPVQNDYDGDGKVDMALWRAQNSGSNDVGRWFIYQSSTSTIRQEQWGMANDIPVPAFYRR